MLKQEIETYHLLPAIRRTLVKILWREGLKQSTISSRLGLTKSAVSQYLAGKRGGEFRIEESILEKCSNKIIKGKNSYKAIQDFITKLKKKGRICKIYMENNMFPEDCEFCKRRKK